MEIEKIEKEIAKEMARIDKASTKVSWRKGNRPRNTNTRPNELTQTQQNFIFEE